MTPADGNAPAKGLGFWGVWALTAGTMIGSGIFLLPTVLAPYGMISFSGWILTAGGSILIALTLGRLASRTDRPGGPYAYTHDAFGDLTGFLVAWGYWIAVVSATAAVAVAFVGYLTIFIPALSDSAFMQALVALALIWGLTLISITGSRSAGLTQLVTTVLKIIPLILIIGYAVFAGSADNLPEMNPTGANPLQALAATALLTMWAFAGLEVGVIPAGDVKDARRTIPRAVTFGVVTVAIIYIASTASVMSLLSPGDLQASTAPFAEAARGIGSWAPMLVAFGALISTAGSLNGNIFISGQMPMAVALDGLAPARLARRNAMGAPAFALVVSSLAGSILLVANYSGGLVRAFTFLLMMSTVFTLAPLLVSALAEFKQSWRTARGWAAIATLGALYSIFAILGSGLETLAWGVMLALAGLPIYVLIKRKKPSPGTDTEAQ